MPVTLACPRCGARPVPGRWAWRCDACGSPLELEGAFDVDAGPSLGEPETPLVRVELGSRQVVAKLEGALPTGSFKDRGSRAVVAALLAHGARHALIDSSGNAGASLAAYCARAGIACDVFVPAAASQAKLVQVEAYRARIVRVLGTRQDVTDAAVAAAAESGAAYASHAWAPWFLAGTATFAREVVAQLGRAPDAVVLPVGAGTLLLGIVRGFDALRREGAVDRVPPLYGVQSAACAPLVVAFEQGRDDVEAAVPGNTAAEGIKIARPPRSPQILAAVRASGGALVAVDDEALWAAFRRLARAGVLVEPTSAVAFAAAESLPLDPEKTVVVAATATGLKAAEAIRAELGRAASS
jgi:threonine synthase